MARGFAYAYKKGQRPANEPAGNHKTLKPEGHAVGPDRRIHRVNPTPTYDVPVATNHLSGSPEQITLSCTVTARQLSVTKQL